MLELLQSTEQRSHPHADYNTRNRYRQGHGVDAGGIALLRKKLRRQALLNFLAGIEPCLIGMEACATAHFWAREIAALGHEVRLIPPVYVKPYVKRQKNDMADAEAICEAVARPNRHSWPSRRLISKRS